MESKVQTELSKLQALSHLSIALSESLSLNDVLYNAVVQCVEVLKFDASVVFFVDETKKRIVAKHFHGISEQGKRDFAELPLDGIGGEVYRTKKSVVHYDLTDYYDFRPAIKKEGVKSIISAPIKIKNEVIGILSAVTKENRMLTKSDKELIESVGLQIGVAYANVQMFESLQNLSDQLQKLVDFSQKISTVIEIGEMMKLISAELQRIFNTEVIVLSLDNRNNIKVLPEKLQFHYNFETIQDILLNLANCPTNRPIFILSQVSNVELKRKLQILGLETSAFLKYETGNSSHLVIIKRNSNYTWQNAEKSIVKAIWKIIENSLKRTEYFQELKKAQERNSILLANQVAAQEKERQRIAQEIHDSINQSLIGMYYYLQFGLEQLYKEPKKTESTLHSLLDMTKENINELRTIINGLHPPTLEKYGFVGAVEVLIKNINKRNKDLKIKLVVEGKVKRLDEQKEIYLYRIIQEGITNIIKHSKSNEARLYIFFDIKGVKIILIDDGVGFDVDKAFDNDKSFGLKGMKKRVEDLGGTLKIISTKGYGTKMEVNL